MGLPSVMWGEQFGRAAGAAINPVPQEIHHPLHDGLITDSVMILHDLTPFCTFFLCMRKDILIKGCLHIGDETDAFLIVCWRKYDKLQNEMEVGEKGRVWERENQEVGCWNNLCGLWPILLISAESSFSLCLSVSLRLSPWSGECLSLICYIDTFLIKLQVK